MLRAQGHLGHDVTGRQKAEVENDMVEQTTQSDRSIEHFCSHPDCARWGGWGFDGGDGIKEWWCLEHRPDADPVVMLIQDENWVSDGNEG